MYSTPGSGATASTAYRDQAIREFLRRGMVPKVSCARGKIICMSSSVTGHTLHIDGGMTLYPGFSTNG